MSSEEAVDYALLKYSTDNLGDEIQSIAVRQFLPRVDRYLDREFLHEVRLQKPTKIILNGWYMHNPDHWPPQDPNLIPLFISFHISDEDGSDKQKFIRPKSLEYFKKFEPIGCRSYSTRDFLRENGIDAYYSGDVTLCLQNSSAKRSNRVYASDVSRECIEAFFGEDACDVIRIFHDKRRHLPKRLHLKNIRPIDFMMAQHLLNTYASAKFVLTSRLHCALPCIAMGIPVLLIVRDEEDPRLDPVIHSVPHCTASEILEGNIRYDSDLLKNLPEIKPLQDSITKTITSFLW